MTNTSQPVSTVDDLMSKFSEALNKVQDATQVQAEVVTGGTMVDDGDATSTKSTQILLSRFDEALALTDPCCVQSEVFIPGELTGRRLDRGGATPIQRHDDSALETKATPFSNGGGTENQNPRYDMDRSSTVAFPYWMDDQGSNCTSEEGRSDAYSELAALRNLTFKGLPDGDGNGNGCSGPGDGGGEAESSSGLGNSTSRSEIQPVTATFQLGGQTVIEPDAMKTTVQQERQSTGEAVASMSDNRSERAQTWVDSSQSRPSSFHPANDSESSGITTTPTPLSSLVRGNFRQKKIDKRISSALPNSGPLNCGGQSGGAPSSTRLWPSHGGVDSWAEGGISDLRCSKMSSTFGDVELSHQQQQDGHDAAKISNGPSAGMAEERGEPVQPDCLEKTDSGLCSINTDTVDEDRGWFGTTLGAGGRGETGYPAFPEASHGNRNHPDGHVAMPSLDSQSTRLGQVVAGSDGGGRGGREQEEGIIMGRIRTGNRRTRQHGEWSPLDRTQDEGSNMEQEAAAPPGSTPSSVEATARVHTERVGQEGMTPAERAAAGVFRMVGGEAGARAGKFGGVRQPEYGGIPLPEETMGRKKQDTPVELSGDEGDQGTKRASEDNKAPKEEKMEISREINKVLSSLRSEQQKNPSDSVECEPASPPVKEIPVVGWFNRQSTSSTKAVEKDGMERSKDGMERSKSFSMSMAKKTAHIWRAVSKRKVEQKIEHMQMVGRSKLGDVVSVSSPNHNFVCGLIQGMRTSIENNKGRKVDRDLQPEDFDSFTKLEYTLDNEQQFKFKDYAPDVFRQMRQMFGVDDETYLASVGQRAGLSEISTEDTGSKSGQKFLITHDGRYFMKTTTASEARFFMKILPHYYRHMKDYRNSLLCRFFGLHRLKPSKMHLLVMGNIFDTDRVVHQRFDLKGSRVGRSVSENEAKKPTVILKDLDFLLENNSIKLGMERKKIYVTQIKADCLFLQGLGVMDYSLLLGVHYRKSGEHEEDVDKIERCTEGHLPVDRAEESSFKAIRKMIERGSGKRTLVKTGSLKGRKPDATHTSDFQVHDGGWASGETLPGGELHFTGDAIYFVGIIDYLQYYNMRKRAETVLKGFTYQLSEVSAVDPKLYAHRFCNFMSSLME